MLTPRTTDTFHKMQMYRLLKELLSDPLLAKQLQFKGGTCAALRGVLPRFSVDLDFDLPDSQDKELIRQKCHQIFQTLDFIVKDESHKHLQFFLRYETSQPAQRNTLKLEINDQPSPFNHYEKIFLTEMNLYCNAQTLGTMFANKLVAALARLQKNGKVAGRDFYDLHAFFLAGLPIERAVVEERTGMGYTLYLKKLRDFIVEHLDEKTLIQDLNPLLEVNQLKKTIKTLQAELIFLLENEIARN